MAKPKYTARYSNGHHVVESPGGEVQDYGTGYNASVRAQRAAEDMNSADRAVQRLTRWENAHPEHLRRNGRRKGG